MVVAPVALSAGLPDTNLVNTCVLVGAYMVSGLLFSPDLDTHSASYRRWGPIRWLWIPYQRMVPHRSWISHAIVIGPVLRILYLAGISALLSLAAFGLLNLLVPIDPSGMLFGVASAVWLWAGRHPHVVAYAMLGFVLGGATHTLADMLFSAIKARLRRALWGAKRRGPFQY